MSNPKPIGPIAYLFRVLRLLRDDPTLIFPLGYFLLVAYATLISLLSLHGGSWLLPR